MAGTVDLAEYLFSRLKQLGAETIYGVPSDFNLTSLDYVQPLGLSWAGNANELAAGYAADGYARIKGISAVCTAFGVGELSAANAIGGAYAEHAPVVHIVGTPPTTLQEQRQCLHHSLGDGNFRVFANIAASLTVAQANLVDVHTAAAQIDETLRQCILQSRPVYIEMPTNMVQAQLSRSRLNTPIDVLPPANDEALTSRCVDRILQRMYAAKKPWIVVDGLAARYGISTELNALVSRSGIITSTTPSGKGIIDESRANYHGVFAGLADSESNIAWANAADLVLRFMPLDADSNTFSFSAIPAPAKSITFHRDSVLVGGTGGAETYSNLHIKQLLQALLDRLEPAELAGRDHFSPGLSRPADEMEALSPAQNDATIDQATFWHRISSFFTRGDIILTETGTASQGARHMILPPESILVNSTLWLSIGYMLPASAGAAAAQRELQAKGTRPATGRTIVFEGDGSLQMTTQSISDMVRARLDVIIFVLNNDGYTIERWIHGRDAHYNDIQPWRYLEAPSYFGAPENDASYPVYTRRATTWGELQRILADPDFGNAKGLRMVEVKMERDDAPETLKTLAQASSKRNFG